MLREGRCLSREVEVQADMREVLRKEVIISRILAEEGQAQVALKVPELVHLLRSVY